MRTTLDRLLEGRNLEAEFIPDALVSYGKDPYQAGKTYSRFAETTIAITSGRPVRRRQLAAVWDLAFNWVVDERHEHNTALPLSVMIALAGLALMWRWAREGPLGPISFFLKMLHLESGMRSCASQYQDPGKNQQNIRLQELTLKTLLIC